MPAIIDRYCQAICLGCPSRDDLVRAVGRLARDELAPTSLTDAEKFEISHHPPGPKTLKLARPLLCPLHHGCWQSERESRKLGKKSHKLQNEVDVAVFVCKKGRLSMFRSIDRCPNYTYLSSVRPPRHQACQYSASSRQILHQKSRFDQRARNGPCLHPFGSLQIGSRLRA